MTSAGGEWSERSSTMTDPWSGYSLPVTSDEWGAA